MLLHVSVRGLPWINVHTWRDHVLFELIDPTDEVASTSLALHLVDPRIRLAFLGPIFFSSLLLGMSALMRHLSRSTNAGRGLHIATDLRPLRRVTILVTLSVLESIKDGVNFGWPYGS
jgi:hypothetical protein